MHPLLQVIKVSWSQEAFNLERIRTAVFIEEQGVPRDIEMDDRDAHCQHVLARVDTKLVGTGRIDLEKSGKIGRVAVLGDYRRQGIGQAIMKALEVIALENGLPEVWLNAQCSALDFYRSLHYQEVGPEFMEADIPHRKMIKQLTKRDR